MKPVPGEPLGGMRAPTVPPHWTGLEAGRLARALFAKPALAIGTMSRTLRERPRPGLPPSAGAPDARRERFGTEPPDAPECDRDVRPAGTARERRRYAPSDARCRTPAGSKPTRRERSATASRWWERAHAPPRSAVQTAPESASERAARGSHARPAPARADAPERRRARGEHGADEVPDRRQGRPLPAAPEPSQPRSARARAERSPPWVRARRMPRSAARMNPSGPA